MEPKQIFVTLGPTGTNHEFATQRFIDFHSINARLELIGDFFEGLEIISRGHADYLVQAAVHPDCADVVAKGHFEYDIHVMDTFISSSKDLAILTRSDIPLHAQSPFKGLLADIPIYHPGQSMFLLSQ
jgi:hypothetical protein